MKLTQFAYDLPEEKIAKYPPKERGKSKLMVIDRNTAEIQHKKYADMVESFEPGDVLVINTTKVEKVRVFFTNQRNNREVESLFLNKINRGDSNEIESWECLFQNSRKVKEGDVLLSKTSEYKVEVEKKLEDGIFLVTTGMGVSEKIFNEDGEVPLPPYIDRAQEDSDHVRYNTIFAEISGSAAAPTAALNMTPELFEKLEEKGVKIAKIQLNIGWGTFAPIRSEDIEDHKIHKEFISVEEEAVNIVNKAKDDGKKIWALGTTVARTLETVVVHDEEGEGTDRIRRFRGNTKIYIHRGYKWNIVDHLITNLHSPQSSLIVMISAFMGNQLMKEAYEQAVAEDYKFLSYGDTMLII
jgi:S-adenosylmethionine:tRNA ribosyltransferase-isomerase